VRGKITVVSVAITFVRVKITIHWVYVEFTLVSVISHSACGNLILLVETNLVRVEIKLVRVEITF
jgi:hypothetical protein